MKRTAAATAVLVLALLAAGCDDDTDTTTTPSPSPSPTAAGDGEVENETYPLGADVSRFCAVVGEIDDAIDEAEPDEESWSRIQSAFEALDALCVPDDLPETGVAELVQVELLVQQSGSVAEFTTAVEDSPPQGRTVDTYIDDHCG